MPTEQSKLQWTQEFGSTWYSDSGKVRVVIKEDFGNYTGEIFFLNPWCGLELMWRWDSLEKAQDFCFRFLENIRGTLNQGWGDL